MRTDSREARVFGGWIGVIWAIAMIIVGWIAWAEVATIHDKGIDGTLTVLAKTREEVGRKGAVTRFYDATIAERPVHIATTKVLPAGSLHSVIFLPVSLRRHEQPEVFPDYIFGRKSETKWQIFIRDLGWPALGIALFLEAFALSGGLWLLSSARRMPLFAPVPTNIPRDKPTAPRKVI